MISNCALWGLWHQIRVWWLFIHPDAWRRQCWNEFSSKQIERIIFPKAIGDSRALYICFSPRSSSPVLFAVESIIYKPVDSESSPLCLQDSHLEPVTKTAGTKGRRRRRQRVLEMLFCPLWCWRTEITLPVTLMAFIVTLWKEEDNGLIFFFCNEGVNTDEDTQANQCTAEDEMLPLSILKHY